MQKREVTILGAGLVGSLLAVLMRKQGHKVTIFERRPDMRRTDIAAGRSINLAMSDRGWKALDLAGLREEIEDLALPMTGRYLHQADGSEAAQPYGKNGEAIYSVSRGELNKRLMTLAENEGATIYFEHRCQRVDVQQNVLYLEGSDGEQEWKADLLFGADGAFSALRSSYIYQDRVDASQFYIEHGYKELHIPPNAQGAMQLSGSYLHIWPRKNFMLIGLPNTDNSFTCTFFFPFEGADSFRQLSDTSKARAFFETHFSDALALMPTFDQDWRENPVSSLITTRISPWYIDDKSALIGDAAHAIVPFYGQGMNAGFEDCSVLFEIMQQYDDWGTILSEYEKARIENGFAVGELALLNFTEMRDKVADPVFLRRKQIEKDLGMRYPGKFNSVYEMVSFSHQPYSKALRLTKLQDELLGKIMAKGDYFQLINEPAFQKELDILIADYAQRS